ncbi:unnamed protein product, partial [Oncorhynchus mykiss]
MSKREGEGYPRRMKTSQKTDDRDTGANLTSPVMAAFKDHFLWYLNLHSAQSTLPPLLSP